MQSGSSLTDLAYIHANPEVLEAYRNRNRRHYNTSEFIEDYRGKPSTDVIRTQINHITSIAEHFISSDANFANVLINVARVFYSINREDRGIYVVQLSSPYPDRFREMAQLLETHVRNAQPNTIVEFS